MIILAFALVGAVIGGITAKRRGGQRLDIAQYAAGYGMAFAIVGLFVTVFLSR
ncbi:hypothetical protein [Maritimibacter dapengensis]|uniref:Apolipoprotein acyltransferase n=1 Tax=Maritimibacter dapengensis TaxID=2836868 RepID=A0ABS6T2B4_9RHOB|nr:hypothetical protein [Maritimibacter dapengensis]MBV7379390.1 hypothetical protein [Maritimibacter dapengensis]